MSQPTRAERAAAVLVRQTYLSPGEPRADSSVERCSSCDRVYEIDEVRGDRFCGIARLCCPECGKSEVAVADPGGVFAEGGYLDPFEELTGWSKTNDS